MIEETINGKKTILGLFRNFSFQELPARYMVPWFIFAQLSSLDAGSHDIILNIVHDETQGVVFVAGIEIPDKHPALFLLDLKLFIANNNVGRMLSGSAKRFADALKRHRRRSFTNSHIEYNSIFALIRGNTSCR